MEVHETSLPPPRTPPMGLDYEVRGRSSRNGDESKANLGLHLITMRYSLPRLGEAPKVQKSLLSLISMVLLVF